MDQGETHLDPAFRKEGYISHAYQVPKALAARLFDLDTDHRPRKELANKMYALLRRLRNATLVLLFVYSVCPQLLNLPQNDTN